MKRSRIFTRTVELKTLTLLSTVFVLFFPLAAWSQETGQSTDANDQTAVTTANQFIQAGLEEYQRGNYELSESAFVKALEYREYLDSAMVENLNDLLAKAKKAKDERNIILQKIRDADKQVNEGKLLEARDNLESVRNSEFIKAEERNLIVEGLKAIDSQIDTKRKEVAEIYNTSVENFRAGELEKARAGFAKIAGNKLLVAPEGFRPEDYLAKIDKALAEKQTTTKTEQGYSSDDVLAKLAAGMGLAQEPVESAGMGGDNYISKIQQKINIIRGHTRAVIADANEKAAGFLRENEFDKAREQIETAQRVVVQNEFYLGKELYREYSGMLLGLTEKIDKQEAARMAELDTQRKKAAAEAATEFKERMERERNERVKELLDRAKTYQKQQRYEEALGQLESLLVIDPLHDEALRMKQTFEDMISFRKQLEVERETNKERVGILLESDKSGIPFAEDITHPKNWREILEKPTRVPGETIGQDPADKATNTLLEEAVDLSSFTPTMGLGTALEQIRNSVSPSLKLFVNWKDLENEMITPETSINMDAISGVPLKVALNNLLDAVSGAVDIGYVVDHGVVTIATEDSLPRQLMPMIYDVTDLIARPANYMAMGTMGGGMGMGGMGGPSIPGPGMGGYGSTGAYGPSGYGPGYAAAGGPPRKQAPEGTKGSIAGAAFGGVPILVVAQTYDVHGQIAALLEELRTVACVMQPTPAKEEGKMPAAPAPKPVAAKPAGPRSPGPPKPPVLDPFGAGPAVKPSAKGSSSGGDDPFGQ